MTVYLLQRLEELRWINVGIVDDLAVAEAWVAASFANGYRWSIPFELNEIPK
jgi:hypothetical protein